MRSDVFRVDGFKVDVFRVDGFRVDVFWFVTFCILKDFCAILYAAYFHFELLHAAGKNRLSGHALVTFFSKEFFSCKYNAHHLFRLNMNEMRNENHKSSLQKMLQKNRNEMINEKSEIFTAENVRKNRNEMINEKSEIFTAENAPEKQE